MFLGCLLALIFDPLKPDGGPFFNLLHAGGGRRFRLPQPFPHLLPILRRRPAAALLLLRHRIWTVVPLISPRPAVHSWFLVWFSHFLRPKYKEWGSDKIWKKKKFDKWDLLSMKNDFVPHKGRRVWSNLAFVYPVNVYSIWKYKNAPILVYEISF